MGWAGNNSESTCPFINDEDHRCDQRLTLRRLDQAFSYCLGGFLTCPTYQQLTWETQPLDLAPVQSAPAAACQSPATPPLSPLPLLYPPRRFTGLALVAPPPISSPAASPAAGPAVAAH